MKHFHPALYKIFSTGLAAALVVGLSVGTAGSPAVAAISKQTITDLNMRSGASTSYKVVAVLNKGAKVSVTSTRGAWSQVSAPKKKGWVFTKYLKTVPKGAAKPSQPGTTPEAVTKTNQSFSAAGLASKYHVYTVASLAPRGILFYLDGDGQWAFDHPTSQYALAGANGIVTQARKRGYITVVVRTPDRKGVPTWWEDGAKNAAYFEALKNKVRAQYPAAKETWLTGYSGGAQFITQSYLPQYPGAIRNGGGAVLMGGGGVPELRVKGFTRQQAASFPMHWYTGAADTAANSDEDYNAIGEAKAGKAWYAKAGFRTSSHYPAGLDHDLAGRFGRAIAKALDR